MSSFIEKPITVVSYNMSYASDLGINIEEAKKNYDEYIDDKRPVKFTNDGDDTKKLFFFSPSELIFLMKYAEKGNPRSCWLKAFDYLKTEILDKKVTVIGLQELNRWFNYDGFEDNSIETYNTTAFNGKPGQYITKDLYDTSKTPKKQRSFDEVFRDDSQRSLGYASYDNTSKPTDTDWEVKNSLQKWGGKKGVEAIVDLLNNKYPNYQYFHGEADETGIGRYAVMTIWDTTVLGNFHCAQVFSSSTVPNSLNRPLTFVVTNKDGTYSLIINIHGQNNPADSAKTYESTKNHIKGMFAIFKNNLGSITITNYFLTGDFNDAFGGFFDEESIGKFRDRTDGVIKEGPYTGEFMLESIPLTFTSEKAPISCCYNWDSTQNTDEQVKFNNDTITMEPMKGPFRDTMSGFVPSQGQYSKPDLERIVLKTTLPENRGKPDNYYYPGDYCFSNKGGVLTVMPAPEGLSDHQPVMLTITPPTIPSIASTGGKSRKRRIRKPSKKSQKRRRSLKKQKHHK